MKRASASPLFSSKDRWSLEHTPAARKPIATITAGAPLPTAEQSGLALALRQASPLVWGDHQGPSDQTTPGAQRACLPDTGTLPPLFHSVGDLCHIGQRAERVLLDAAPDPAHFLATLKQLLGPARQLARHPDIPPAQAACLERLPMTALAIAHQQGLTQDPWCLEGITALVQEHIIDPVDAPPRDLRSLGQVPLEMKKACLKTLLNQPPPCGPVFIAQWAWAARHWTEPDLRPYLLEGVEQLLTEAAKGVRDDTPFQGAFLFDQFPEDLLLDAFYRVGGPDNARLLQLRPMTLSGRTLLDHYLSNPDIPRADRQRLRHWHGMA